MLLTVTMSRIDSAGCRSTEYVIGEIDQVHRGQVNSNPIASHQGPPRIKRIVNELVAK
jgi:hypothetical protein